MGVQSIEVINRHILLFLPKRGFIAKLTEEFAQVRHSPSFADSDYLHLFFGC